MTLSKPIRINNEELNHIMETTTWNERETAFFKPYMPYVEFCKKNLCIVNTVSSYMAYEDDCLMWKKIAIGLILEDRKAFNDQ